MRSTPLFVALAAFGIATPFALHAAAPNARPNIIFLLADDLGYGDIGAYGQKKIRTPNLDQLAQDGMRFTNAYSGHNVCAPSRCVLMTAKHPGHAYIRNAADKKPGDLELYNLKGDPAETKSVAAQHPDIVAKMTAIMIEQHVPTVLWPISALDGERASPPAAKKKKKTSAGNWPGRRLAPESR